MKVLATIRFETDDLRFRIEQGDTHDFEFTVEGQRHYLTVDELCALGELIEAALTYEDDDEDEAEDWIDESEELGVDEQLLEDVNELPDVGED